MVWPDVEFWKGMVAASLPLLFAWWRMRAGRETRAQQLYDKIMSQVHVENAELKATVEECKKRDARVMIVEICFRMIITEMIRLDPSNSVLVQVKLLLEVGPIPADNSEMEDLLAQIDRRTNHDGEA